MMGLIGALHRWQTFHNTFFDIAWGAAIGVVWALYAVGIWRNSQFVLVQLALAKRIDHELLQQN